MAITISKETAYVVDVEDRPGILAEATRVAAEAGLGFSLLAGWPAGPGRAKLCSVPENPEKLKALAKSRGIPLTEQTLFLVRGDNQVGALTDVARRLGDAGINICDLAALSVGGKFAALVVVREADVARAAAALGC